MDTMDGLSPLPTPQWLSSSPNAQQLELPTLLGEHPLLVSKTTEGHAIVTNFRFCVYERQLLISIPVMVVGEMLVVEAAKRLRIGCKDGSMYSCTFATAEDCQACMSMLKSKTGPPQSTQDLFAYKFYAAATCKQSLKTSLTTFEEAMIALCQPVGPDFAYIFDKEVERLGFDTESGKIWRISHANSKFELCPTYPKFHILPAAVDDDTLKVSLDFRALKRFPSVVWRDKRTGMVLIRSSQPLSSFLGVSYFTNHADVSLIEEIVNACNRDWLNLVSKDQAKSSHNQQEAEASNNSGLENGQRVNSHSNSVKSGSTSGSNIRDCLPVTPGRGTGDNHLLKKLAIVDCRSLAGVWGNSFKGGGTEDEAVYKCNIVHLDLANIHTVRDSFHKLMAMRHTYVEGMLSKNFSGCMWLNHVSALLRGANIVAELMHVRKRPVLVHCSDGWDRTSQIVSLSELLMDPFYRTLRGFQVLVEREWLHFGHKFGERGGHDPRCCDTNQMSPIFLQFLDCVHQLTMQYPAEFQFNEHYLMKLLQHSQACLFGNFLHNCQKERENCQLKTASVWSLLTPERTRFVNLKYKPSDQVLIAKSNEPDVVLWKSVYLPGHMSLISHTNLCHGFDLPALGEHGVASTNEIPGPKSMEDLSQTKVGIVQGPKTAAKAPKTDGLHTESTISELVHLPEDSTQSDSKRNLTPDSGSNLQALPWEKCTHTSDNCDLTCISEVSESVSPESVLKASSLRVFHEEHKDASLENFPSAAPQTSSLQICLRHEASSTGKGSNIQQERDALSANTCATQNLVSPSTGFHCQEQDLIGSCQLLCCDNSAVWSNNSQLPVSNYNPNDSAAAYHNPIVRSKSLDSISSVSSNSQLFTPASQPITLGYCPLQASTHLELWTDSDVIYNGCIENINSMNTVTRVRHQIIKGNLRSVKSDSHFVPRNHSRGEFYRKLGINSNNLTTGCLEGAKVNVKSLKGETIETGVVNGGILVDSVELGGIIGARTDINGARTDINDARTNAINGARTNAINGTTHAPVDGTKIHSKFSEVAIESDRTFFLLKHGDQHLSDGDMHLFDGDEHLFDGDEHLSNGDEHLSNGDEHLSNGAAINQSSDRLQGEKAALMTSPPKSRVSQCTCRCWSDLGPNDFGCEREDVARRLLQTRTTKSTTCNSGSHIVQIADASRRYLNSVDKLRESASEGTFKVGGEPETKAVTCCVHCDSGSGVYRPGNRFRDERMICQDCCSSDKKTSHYLDKQMSTCLRCCSQKCQETSSDGCVPTLMVDG